MKSDIGSFIFISLILLRTQNWCCKTMVGSKKHINGVLQRWYEYGYNSCAGYGGIVYRTFTTVKPLTNRVRNLTSSGYLDRQ